MCIRSLLKNETKIPNIIKEHMKYNLKKFSKLCFQGNNNNLFSFTKCTILKLKLLADLNRTQESLVYYY